MLIVRHSVIVTVGFASPVSECSGVQVSK